MKKPLFILIGFLLIANCFGLQPKPHIVRDFALDDSLRQLYNRSFNLLPQTVSTIPTTTTLQAGQTVWYVSGTTERLYYNLNGTIDYLVDSTALALTANAYPQRATMWHDEATVITGNDLRSDLDVSQIYSFYSLQNPSADADSFSHSFFLKAGTYTFSVLGRTNINSPKIDWYIDGVKVISLQDWYSNPTVYNVVMSTVSITVTGDGYHKLVGTVNGRNASNTTAWNVLLTKYWFKKTADADRE